jgi:hypothetical protein
MGLIQTVGLVEGALQGRMVRVAPGGRMKAELRQEEGAEETAMADRANRLVETWEEVPEAGAIWDRAPVRQALVLLMEATVPREEVAAEQVVAEQGGRRHMGVTVGMAAMGRSGTQLTAQAAVGEEVQAAVRHRQMALVVRAVFMAAARVGLAMTIPATEPRAVRASSC